MKESPFQYGSTVSLYSFTNREKETKKLYCNLTRGINTMLISPRRWGKSSLVEKVIYDINKEETKTKTVIMDLFMVSSEEEFLNLFAKEVIKASSSKWEDWAKSGQNFFKKLVPKISFGIDPATDFSLSFDWEEIIKHKNEILDLPEIVSKSKKIKLIICLDEFQNISSFRNYEILEKNMRAIWQRHKNVTYCLYGSKRHMMTDIFNNSSKPFYRFGDIMLLQKIKTDKWIDFIVSGFESMGKSISKKNANLIPIAMKDHSWYVQQLSHYTLQKTKRTVHIDDIYTALTELISANSPLFQREVEDLSSTQLNLLKAIIQGETKLTSVKIMRKYRLGTPNNVLKNKKKMMGKDIIYESDKKYEVLDPAFEMWFLKQFYNQDYINCNK